MYKNIENDETLDINMDIIDNSWIHNYEILEQDYCSFYKEPVDSIKLYFIYVNKNNEIDNIIQDDLIILQSKIEKVQIYKIIKTHNRKNEIDYKLIGLFKYNISLEPHFIKEFLEDKIEDNYLNSLYTIDDIVYEDTITLFKDLNSLYFIFYDKSNDTKLKSKIDQFKENNRIKNKDTNLNSENQSCNTTKKVSFNLKPKKTKRR